MDYQRGLKNEEERDSDIPNMTDIDEQSIIDTLDIGGKIPGP